MLNNRQTIFGFNWIWVVIGFFAFVPLAYAGGSTGYELNFLWLAVLLLLAKLSSLIEKWKQPAVLGELLVGVVLGNLVLLNIGVFEEIKHNEMLKFLSELGVVILLFQIGLESELEQMRKVGWRAFLVACVGVAVPFILGAWIVGPWILPGLEFNAYLFLGATLTATSVGITGRVFRDLNKLQTPEAQIVLGAAVIDDVIGLIILAVVSAIVTTGAVDVWSIGWITLKAFLFLTAALFVGQWLAPWLSKLFSKVNQGVIMKFTLAVSFCLIFAYLAFLADLAPIVGAFAAGLVLEHVHFTAFLGPTINEEIEEATKTADKQTRENVALVLEHNSKRHLEELIAPLGYFLVPLFFIMTGLQVNLQTLFDPSTLMIALVITVVAFVGKLVSGIVAGPVNKYIVGWGMAPRGEVGLIFAMMGKHLGVISETTFSVVVIMVILTTLLTPIILTYLLRRQES